MSRVNLFSGKISGKVGDNVFRSLHGKNISQHTNIKKSNKSQGACEKATLFAQCAKIVALIVRSTSCAIPPTHKGQKRFQLTMQYLKQMYNTGVFDATAVELPATVADFITSVELSYDSTTEVINVTVVNALDLQLLATCHYTVALVDEAQNILSTIEASSNLQVFSFSATYSQKSPIPATFIIMADWDAISESGNFTGCKVIRDITWI